MTAFVALLRAINVAGHNRVAMSDLLGVVASLGLEGGRSLLQTGNLIFRGDGRSGADLEQALESETERRLSLRTDYLVRSSEEWRALIDRNPFPEQAKREPGRLVVLFLKAAPGPGGVEAVQAATPGPEIVRADGKHLYIVYREGIGRSKLTTSLIEGKLGTRGTARNWNTVLKIGNLLQA